MIATILFSLLLIINSVLAIHSGDEMSGRLYFCAAIILLGVYSAMCELLQEIKNAKR